MQDQFEVEWKLVGDMGLVDIWCDFYMAKLDMTKDKKELQKMGCG